MPGIASFLTATILALGCILRRAGADCNGLNCDTIYIFTSDDQGQPIPGGLDPHDDALLGIWTEICACSNEELALTVVYTGNDAAATTESSTATLLESVSTALTFSFTGTQNQIQSGSFVTQTYQIDGSFIGQASWIYSPVTSLYYTETTQTVTTTNTEEDTVTATDTTTSTSTLAPLPIFSSCTTGTFTVTASTSTVTIDTTITPTARTITVPKVTCTTTHAKCVREASPPHRNYKVRREAHLANRQQDINQGTVETPWYSYYFGSPQSTTYTTGTTVTTTGVLVTDTTTSTVTETDTTTSTPAPTTVCVDVEATTSITPTITVTDTLTAKRSTTKVTHTYTITETIFPHYPPHPCTCRPAPPTKTYHTCATLTAAPTHRNSKPKGHSHE